MCAHHISQAFRFHYYSTLFVYIFLCWYSKGYAICEPITRSVGRLSVVYACIQNIGLTLHLTHWEKCGIFYLTQDSGRMPVFSAFRLPCIGRSFARWQSNRDKRWHTVCTCTSSPTFSSVKKILAQVFLCHIYI